MNYKYYKLNGKIFRIHNKVEFYWNDQWIRSVLSFTTFNKDNSHRLTKEEAFMEML